VGDPTIRRGTYNDTLLGCRLIYRDVNFLYMRTVSCKTIIHYSLGYVLIITTHPL